MESRYSSVKLFKCRTNSLDFNEKMKYTNGNDKFEICSINEMEQLNILLRSAQKLKNITMKQ